MHERVKLMHMVSEYLIRVSYCINSKDSPPNFKKNGEYPVYFFLISWRLSQSDTAINLVNLTFNVLSCT